MLAWQWTAVRLLSLKACGAAGNLLVFQTAPAGQFPVHSDMLLVDPADILHHPLAGFGQETGLFGGCPGFIGQCAAGTDLMPGAVSAVMADIEGFESFRSGCVGDRDEFIGMIDTGGTFGIDAEIRVQALG